MKTTYLSKLRRDLVKQRHLLMMIWPAVIWMAIFSYIPIFGIVVAFKDYNVGLGVLKSPWVGFKYFIELFSDKYFFNSLRNTLMYSLLNLIIGFPIPILFALLLNELSSSRTTAYKRVVQTLSYLPHFLSWTFVASFLILFLADDGLLNQLLISLGVLESGYAYMANPGSFIVVILMSSIWKSFGYSSIIYLAAMTSVSQEMYEAALIDGANRWQKIFYITIPSIKPTVVVLLILAISEMMHSNFEQFYLLQNGLVSEVARVMDVYTYSIGFELGRFSYGTAVGLFKSVCSLVMLLLANSVSRRITGEYLI